MNRFLQELAESHKRHEGWFVPGQDPRYPHGSLSYRNNNPGNLRLTDYYAQKYGAIPGQRNFAKFPNYDRGFEALMEDLKIKITGKSVHIDYSKNPTFLDYIRVYAPASDWNVPRAYAYAVIEDMDKAGYEIEMYTPLSELAKLVEDKPSTPIDTEYAKMAQQRRLNRLIQRLRRLPAKVYRRAYLRLHRRFI